MKILKYEMWFLLVRMFMLLCQLKIVKYTYKIQSQLCKQTYTYKIKRREVKHIAAISGPRDDWCLLFTRPFLDFSNVLQCLQSTH